MSWDFFQLKHEQKMPRYHIEVCTDANMGSEKFISGFIHDWFDQLPSNLHPDRFGKEQRARKTFADEGQEGAIKAWLDSKMPILIKKSRKPKIEASGFWWPTKDLDSSIAKLRFPWEYSILLDISAGDESALCLMRFLINHFNPAFGSICSYEDKREKHLDIFPRTLPDGSEVEVSQWAGAVPGKTLPGIYWTTYFGPWSLEKIGRDKFANLRVPKCEPINNGLLVVAYQGFPKIDRVDARRAEKEIVRLLGKQKFFDLETWQPPED